MNANRTCVYAMPHPELLIKVLFTIEFLLLLTTCINLDNEEAMRSMAELLRSKSRKSRCIKERRIVSEKISLVLASSNTCP